MLALRLQVMLIIVMVLVAVYIIHLLRKQKIAFTFGLMWLLVDACILVLTIFPNVLNKIADLVGIATPVNMLFFFGFCFSVAIIFYLTLMVSRLSDRVVKLSQEIAIIRKDMYDGINEVKTSTKKEGE